jgi:hypothetical protein
MIIHIQHTANWECIKKRKQRIIDLNNKRENSNRQHYVYRVEDKMLLNRGIQNKYESLYIGQLDIMQVNENGTVHLKANAVENTYNIRRIIPYHIAPDPDHGGECNMRTAKNKRKHIVRFEPTNLRIGYLKNYLREIVDDYIDFC